MTEKFSLNVNGESHAVVADPDTPLLYVLRDDLGLNNPHFGCGFLREAAFLALQCPNVYVDTSSSNEWMGLELPE